MLYSYPGMSGPETAGQLLAAAMSVRVFLPVCQNRPVLYPLGIAAHAINRTTSAEEGTLFKQA